jgi:hypothetical protein
MPEEYQFDSAGRMKYHPEVHFNQGKPWKVKDVNYLIKYYETLGPDQVALDLGRTIGVIGTKAYQLRKAGLMPKRTTRKTFKRNEGFK